ncbi:MAG: GGDEF domain-containing phosphodiesterase [Campylobacterota bacterium]|nr:GGDEF domain-containing phosphodiesterase [Campylobacterota bacterium]
MDYITSTGIVAVLAAIVLFAWMKWYYAKEIGRLKGEVKLFKNANECQDEAVVVFSGDYEVLSANRAARKLLHFQPFHPNMIPEKEILIQVGHSDPQALFEVIKKQGNITKGTIHLEKVVMTIEGSVHHVNLYIDHAEWNFKNSVICVFQDAGSEFKEDENLKILGEIDFLTDLPSQFKANSDINKLVIAAQRESEKLAFYIFGINNFEKIKTTFGLSYTNNLLKKFAEFLTGLESENASSYRLDCDNFLYIVKDIGDDQAALEKGKDISKKISRFFKLNSKNAHLIFSTGIVLFPDHGKNASKLIDHAYGALEKSKKKEDGSVEIFQKEMHEVHDNEKLIAEEIKQGLEKREFEVYYQPIIDLKTMDVGGAEALIRWNHPRLGLITPDKFIHMAETSGLIIDIGEYVLEEVIRQHRHWSEFGFKDIEISINLSVRELLTYQLGERLEQLFIDEKVNPRYFNLDMSEGDAMEDAIKADLEFSILKKIGVNLSIDHFGVGGSSIEQLQKLPIHTLKIDRSLLNNVDTDKNHQETVKAIVVLAHALNLEVVAGGIETKEQYSMLKKLGCDHAQGYIFSKPAPAFEFQELIRVDSNKGR